MSATTAAEKAQRAALKAGMTASQVRGAAARARAEAIHKDAARLGVSVSTARGYARGKPAGQKAESNRQRLVRSMGGAKEIRATQLERMTHVNLGKVRVTVSSGDVGKDDHRYIDVDVDPSAMREVAHLIRQGEEAKALEKFEHHVLNKYGDGLGDVMSIVEIENVVTFQ